MSSIDLAVLGMVLERPRSAYEIQKDVESHHFSRWTKISVSSIYKKVLQLKENGYLESEAVKGNKFAEKAVYTITAKGKAYFNGLMDAYASQNISFLFDFNVVISNLNKVEKVEALVLIQKLRDSILRSAQINDGYAAAHETIPLVGRTIFAQQKLLYETLLDWLGTFELQYKAET